MNFHKNNNNYKKNNPLLEESSFSGESPELELEKRKTIQDLKKIGDFVQGGGSGGFGSGKIDNSNNTLAITIQNNTTAVQQASLFQFSESLFTGVQNPAPSQLPSPTVPVGIATQQTEVCLVNNFLYVTDTGSDTISIIDCSTPSGTFVTTIILPIGFAPYTIAYSITNNQMYVAGSGFASIIIIDCVTNTIIGAIPIPNVFSSTLSYNSIKNSLYYYDPFASTINEINCNNNLLVAIIPFVAPSINAITFNSTLNRMYFNDIFINTVFVLDCVLNVVLFGLVTPLFQSASLVFCSSNNNVYFTDLAAPQIVGLDCSTNLFNPIINYGAGNATGFLGMAYNSVNNLVYSIVQFPDLIIEVDPTTNSVSNTYPLPFLGYFALTYNSNNNTGWLSASFVNAIQAFTPTLPPTPIVTYSGNISPAVIYNDTQTKPFIIRGLKMIVSDISQLGNNLKIGNRSYTGAVDNLQWQPLNYVSPTTRFTGIIDAPDFEFDVDRGPDSATIDFDVNPLSKVTIIFSIGDSLDSSVLTNDKPSRIEKSKVTRKTGNPIFDLIQENDSKAKKEGESDFNPIEFANYPRLVGNPIADITILRDSGIQGI